MYGWSGGVYVDLSLDSLGFFIALSLSGCLAFWLAVYHSLSVNPPRMREPVSPLCIKPDLNLIIVYVFSPPGRSRRSIAPISPNLTPSIVSAFTSPLSV
jgi:hypothetical protein